MRVAALVPGMAPLDHGRLHESRQSGSGALAGLYILGVRAGARRLELRTLQPLQTKLLGEIGGVQGLPASSLGVVDPART